MTTIHLVYPAGPRISAPQTIGRHLAAQLAGDYRVVHHNLDGLGAIEPEPGDVLLGHPHPIALTCFRRSARRRGWRRVIAMCPFNGDPGLVGYLDPVLRDCDLFLAITGPYWFEQARTGLFASWFPKMVRLDLAVDRAEFPPLKHAFSPPGRRRFLYVGNCSEAKNVGYLSAIARRMPDVNFGWIGGGGSIDGVRSLGYADFSTDAGRQLVAPWDFLITVGRHDANPTTILEAMSWGLVPVCTPQSGYSGVPGIHNVPLDDVDGAVSVLRYLQDLDGQELVRQQAANWALLEERFGWGRFGQTVREAIECGRSPPLAARPREVDQRLRVARWTGRNSPFQPWMWRDLARAQAGRAWRRFRVRRGAGTAP